MEDRISTLEAELEERTKSNSAHIFPPINADSEEGGDAVTAITTVASHSATKQEDETSSDGGIESGTEVDGEIV